MQERVRVATGGRPSPQAHSRHHRRSGKRRSHSKQGSSDQAKAEDTEEPAEWWNGFYAENDPGGHPRNALDFNHCGLFSRDGQQLHRTTLAPSNLLGARIPSAHWQAFSYTSDDREKRCL